MKTSIAFLLALLFAAPVMAQQATPAADGSADLPDRIVGDIGAGVFHLERNGLSRHSHNNVLPYAYFDYGRFFARLDTFGVKTARLGYGYLEFAGRINFEGFDADHGLHRRSDPIPLGIGTYQETPYGAFFLNTFYDFNKSHGMLAEAIYAAQVDVGRVSIYPQAGVEYRSGNYNDYFFGVTSGEAAASGLKQYSAGSSTNPILGLSADMPVFGDWRLNLTWRRKWLDNSVADSPLVHRKIEDMALVALSYHFK
ncbi:MAG: MltA-interacting protein [Herbaspirillum frisingense]|uniref:MltA-interacting protein n=1 Tax=Herbaspirillum frisingense TaxID=92645 RepID=A0A7V8FWT2_9BURK|nr:MAG: MltA-interacting protein [Herbaspirillum frisingense]